MAKSKGGREVRKPKAKVDKPNMTAGAASPEPLKAATKRAKSA